MSATYASKPAPGLLLALLFGGAAAAQQTVVEVPASDGGANLLESRREAQLRTLDRFRVPHDFAFTDRREASGITFLHRSTEDGTKHYKMVHYDHGNGLAVADVDGDGRYDLYFVNQVGPNELWRNLGQGKFRDVTGEAGVAVADRVSVAASFGDVDNDGDPDLYVTTVNMGNLLFENDGKGRFRDVSSRAGVGHVAHSSGAVFFDYDLDGWLDLFVTNVGRYTTHERGPGGYFVGVTDAFHGHLKPELSEASVLYRNLGKGSFRDVSEQVKLVDRSWSGDAAFADLNGDRYPDLYVLNMQGDDHYYENQGGKAFVDRTAERFPATPWGAMGVKFFDVNGDGLLDLYLTDMHSDMSQEVPPYAEKLKSDMTWSEAYLEGGANNVFGNALYLNRGGGRFEEVSDLMGAENYWPWGLSVGDLNADGWEDAFVASSMSYPWRYGINSVLLNNAGATFLDSEFILGVEPRAGGRTKVEYFELDCAGADKGHEHCAGQEGRITVLGNLGTRSSALFDLDDDGDLDIVTSEFHAQPQVLVSDLAQRHPVRFLKVRLVGTRSNRDGLGAVVEVKAGSRTLTRQHDGKSGYLSQSTLPLYFGLGDAGAVDRVEVRWPSGAVQTLSEGIKINGVLEIVEK